MDLSKISNEDLLALKAGDLSKVSSAGLMALSGRAPAQPAYDPSEGGGELRPFGISTGIKTPQWLDRGLSGAGKAFADLGRGVGQMTGQVSRDDVAESRKIDAPLMNTGAGVTGNIAGNVAMLAPTAFVPGANTVTGAGLIGGITGALQPSVSTGETLTNAGLGIVGGSGGQAAANKLGALALSRNSAVTQGQAAAARDGTSVGMKLTPGKASGSKGLQRLEAAMESNPITASGFDSIKEVNQKAINRAAAKAVGESADELSAPVIARAQNRIGGVLDSVKDKTPVPLDPVAFGGRLNQIAKDSEGMLMGNAELSSNGLWKRLDDFVNNQGGASREQLRSLSSNLGKAAKNNMTQPNGDRALGEALFEAQHAVEDAIAGTLTGAQKQAYDEARGQYRNLMLLTAKSGIVNPSSGNVSGKSLAGSLMRGDRSGFTIGNNTTDMYKAARFVQAFPDIVGDSGTATRSMGAADYLAGIPGGLLSHLYLSKPVTKAATAGSGAAGLAGLLGAPTASRLGAPAGVASLLAAPYLFQQ